MELVDPTDLPVLLRHGGYRGRLRCDFDVCRIAQMLASDVGDRARQGRREQRDLFFLGRVAQDLLDIVEKAHAQHLVGLVENHRPQNRQVERLAAKMIEDAPRRTDHGVDAAAQVAQLDVDALAAIDRQHVETLEAAGVGLEGLRHLQRQLAGRRHHQDLRPLPLQVEAAQQRQREGCRLAGAGLGLAQDIAPCEQRRNDRRLNRRRRLVADLVDREQDFRAQADFGETGGCGS